MDRRKYLKLIAAGAVAIPAAISGCAPGDEQQAKAGTSFDYDIDRYPEEMEYERKLLAMDRFFTDHEMASITILADMIIPKDEVSGSASDAGVPAFIEFIVKDMPGHQVPMRGGLRWLDMQCLKQFDHPFRNCSDAQRIAIVDQIAYPQKAGPGMEQGVAFFSLMRNLTATGFYTSEIGVKDIGYEGNKPTQWTGVSPEVLQQYGLAYTEKEMKETISFDK